CLVYVKIADVVGNHYVVDENSDLNRNQNYIDCDGICLDLVADSNDHGSHHKSRSEFTKWCIGDRVRSAGIQITDEHADKADKRYPPTGFQANIDAKQSCQAEKGKSKI